MRYLLATFATLLLGVSVSAQAEEPNLSRLKCPASPAATKHVIYEREHEVPVVGADAPATLMTDVLTVVGQDPRVLCFGLITFARNGHMCGIMGVARAVPDGSYLLEDGDVRIRLAVLSSAQIQVEPIDERYRARCGFFGRIESAVYELRDAG